VALIDSENTKNHLISAFCYLAVVFVIEAVVLLCRCKMARKPLLDCALAVRPLEHREVFLLREEEELGHELDRVDRVLVCGDVRRKRALDNLDVGAEDDREHAQSKGVPCEQLAQRDVALLHRDYLAYPVSQGGDSGLMTPRDVARLWRVLVASLRVIWDAVPGLGVAHKSRAGVAEDRDLNLALIRGSARLLAHLLDEAARIAEFGRDVADESADCRIPLENLIRAADRIELIRDSSSLLAVEEGARAHQTNKSRSGGDRSSHFTGGLVDWWSGSLVWWSWERGRIHSSRSISIFRERCKDNLLLLTRMRKFLVIVETNHKEKESFVHYCESQDSLTNLLKAIEKADPSELWGDVSHFTCSWLKVSEEAVDVHLTLKELGKYNHMFQKHTGVFNCPTFPEDPKDIARKLDDYFYGCRLGDYFKK
jgi:hypothetical protein